MKSSVTQKARKTDELEQFEESRGKFLFLHKMGDKDFPYRDDRKPKFNDRKDQIIFFIHSFLYYFIHLFTPSKKYLLNALIVSDIVLEMKRKIRNDCYLLMKLTLW